jgi:hypothetical protein
MALALMAPTFSPHAKTHSNARVPHADGYAIGVARAGLVVARGFDLAASGVRVHGAAEHAGADIEAASRIGSGADLCAIGHVLDALPARGDACCRDGATVASPSVSVNGALGSAGRAPVAIGAAALRVAGAHSDRQRHDRDPCSRHDRGIALARVRDADEANGPGPCARRTATLSRYALRSVRRPLRDCGQHFGWIVGVPVSTPLSRRAWRLRPRSWKLLDGLPKIGSLSTPVPPYACRGIRVAKTWRSRSRERLRWSTMVPYR